ncbi:hypothetical protein HAP48_0005675 [Bradyrhizobium septentrionale]|uniref:Uncharacterized protein n=2 Tax=Bradyrhizobium TaxID=374 RepID=A0A973W721_9BRAD|nr:hypothetical protein [Bradyrhizobium septentrionale]UGY16961.1 hypothetical protein HAP48_0005675 [Bradyrhizobium septentrionale]UGY25712.1 hypothetical protein HU675_0002440 [Bradyrhizobium septentrionale]
MGEMASAIAHEINQPVFATTNYLLGPASDKPDVNRVGNALEHAARQASSRRRYRQALT